MIAPGHVCVESLNPRKRGWCEGCGQRMPGPQPRYRNLTFERDLTKQAAKGVASAEAIIRHSEARATALSGEYVTDHMLVATGRDRARDVREELSDARNHLCWLAEEHIEDEDVARSALIALRHIVLAYNTLLDED